MKFLIGLATGLILAWGTPKWIGHLMVMNPPGTPADYRGPKYINYKFGVEQQ